MTNQLPAPTSVIRPTSAAHWEVMPSENDTLHGIHTVKRFADAKWGQTVSIHYGRIDAQNTTTLRVGPQTARLLAEALLAAGEWTDEAQQAIPELDTPRQWQAGDLEPKDVTKVRDGTTLLIERHPDGWHPLGCPRTKCTGMPWAALTFPLTAAPDA